MPNDIINRQFFEFTCGAEKTAKQVRHEIETHTARRINEIISSVFAQVIQNEDYLKIDKIEIDLGNVTIHDFGGKEMLSSFRERLQQQIIAIRQSRYHDSENVNNGVLIQAPFQNGLEMIRSFLLRGILPWWVDKTFPIDIDAIIQQLLSRHPEDLKQLLNEHIAKPNVILRLFTQMKPVTVSKITELMPVISELVSKEIFTYDTTQAAFDSLSPIQITRIKKIFAKLPQTPAERLRPLLVNRLVQFYRFVRANKIPVEETDPGKLLLQLKATQLLFLLSASYNTNISKERSRKRELTRLVKDFTIFQAELLLFQLSFDFDTKQFANNGEQAADYLNGDDQAMPVSVDAGDYTSPKVSGDITYTGNISTKPSTDLTTEIKIVQGGEAAFTGSQKEAIADKLDQPPQFSDNYTSPTVLKENQGNRSQDTSQDVNSRQIDKDGKQKGNGGLTSDKPEGNSLLSGQNDTGIQHEDNPTTPAEDFDRQLTKTSNLSAGDENAGTINSAGIESHSLPDGKQESTELEDAGNIAQQKKQGVAAPAEEGTSSRPNLVNYPEPVEKEQSPGPTNQEEPAAPLTHQQADEALKTKQGSKDYPPIAEKMERNQEQLQNQDRAATERDSKNYLSLVKKAAAGAGGPDRSKDQEMSQGVAPAIEETIPGSVAENYLPNDEKARTAAVPDTSESNSPQTKQEEPAIVKMIAFIMKKLNTSDAVIVHYLQRLDKKSLEHIAAIFKKHVREDLERKKTVNGLLGHPALLKNNMLKIFANLVPATETKSPLSPDPSSENRQDRKSVPAKLVKKIQSSQTIFASYIKKLPIKDLLIIKEIFRKGSFDSDSEKSLLKKTLLKLPEENILLLKFLAELPQQEIAQLMASATLPLQSAAEMPDRQKPTLYNKESPQKILIENAGLCLLALYLPGFFKRLGYVENGMFKNKGLAIRAIYILQYITTGQIKSPEYLLQFNKLLCGFGIDDYITKSTRLTKKEISEAGNLLEAVIKNWPVLKNTSPNGLRESFLKRKGILLENESKWTLQVEKKGFDVLLSTIPWGYGMIKFSWMEKLLEVEWF